MKRILVLAPQFVGDTILTIPFLRELKKHCGRVEIDVVSKNAGLKILSACPYIANLYDYKTLNCLDLRKSKYDKVYVLKRSFSAAVIAFITGAKERVGFGGQFREFLLTKTVKYDKSEHKHEKEHFMDVLREDYVEINNDKLEYYVDNEAALSVKKYFSTNKKVLFVACSSTPVKNWSCEKFAKIAEWFSKNNYDIYFAGLETEKSYCDEIINLTNNIATKNLCGKLTFEEIIALISEMDFVFGIDSGFCHVAAAFDKKVMALFGPTPVYQWKPIGINSYVVSSNAVCAPCKKPKDCQKDYICMKNITAEDVIAELEKVL